jgi:Small metal-binding protein
MGFPRTRELMLFTICCMFGLVSARAEDHGKKAQEHLQEAIESGKKGNAAEVLFHTEKARRELIEDNKEHPYTRLQKPIYGEHEKAEHDKEAFEEIEEAIGEAEDGDVQDATQAAARASAHLREKEEAK